MAGVPYDQQVVAEGVPEPEVTVDGLPEGLAHADGRITGTATAAGTYPVVVTATNEAGDARRTLELVVGAGAPAQVTVESGSGQSARFGTAFADPLVALVTDAFGNPVPGADVAFVAPASGPGTEPRRSVATTGPDGLAEVAVTAGSLVGAYDVRATSGEAVAGTFRLANAYDVGPFAAPYDTSPVTVGRADPVNLSFVLSDADGPVDREEAVELSLACRVVLVSEPVTPGAGSSSSQCVRYDLFAGRFRLLSDGLLLGWESGVDYRLRVTVLGTREGDLLGRREVRVSVR